MVRSFFSDDGVPLAGRGEVSRTEVAVRSLGETEVELLEVTALLLELPDREACAQGHIADET